MKKRKIKLKAPEGYDDSPLTARELKSGRPLRDVFPDLAEFSRRQRARKGEPKKQGVYMRLSPEVIDYFKSKGSGWQTRINRALLAIIEAAK